MQNAEDTPWERVKLFPADYTRKYGGSPWCLSSGNTFPERHGLYEAVTAY